MPAHLVSAWATAAVAATTTRERSRVEGKRSVCWLHLLRERVWCAIRRPWMRHVHCLAMALVLALAHIYNVEGKSAKCDHAGISENIRQQMNRYNDNSIKISLLCALAVLYMFNVHIFCSDVLMWCVPYWGATVWLLVGVRCNILFVHRHFVIYGVVYWHCPLTGHPLSLFSHN